MKTDAKTNWRWWICSLLFIATTVNYLDRQVLSLTYEEFIKPQFGWSDADYGTVTGFFSLVYAISCLFAGKFIDWIGVKKGYIISICVWSLGACLHATVGLLAMTVAGSVYLFMTCRGILALGESGNFPSAIKVTAEYFPKKDRAFATTIFNAGASVGALAAPLCIPTLAKNFGWEMAFIIIGCMGFLWIFLWVAIYEKPEKSRHVNKAELTYILQDDTTEEKDSGEEIHIPLRKCLRYKQTWAILIARFVSDCVWWFFLFWAPSYFDTQFGAKSTTLKGKMLLLTLYAICTILSIFGGWLPKMLVEKKGMHPFDARMRSMFFFALVPLVAILSQPLGAYYNTPWLPAIFIGLAAAGHSAWAAGIFSLVGDIFPKGTIATMTGMSTLAGGLSTMILQKVAGNLFTFAENAGSAFRFLGFEGKPAGYFIIFCYCGLAYIIAWTVMRLMMPRYKPVVE